MDKQKMAERMRTGRGFIAALDQSGGSTPKALRLYGIGEGQYSDEASMFDLIHSMRTRIMTSPAFTSERILAAILFEQTMDRDVEGMPTAQYLWERKGIVPILKVDKGLMDVADSVQLMKPMPDLGDLLARATTHGIFGTKMRSVIKESSAPGIRAVVEQQFEIAADILYAGLVPIIEPEVDIKSASKQECERILRDELLRGLEPLADGQQVMFKLTIPTEPGFYQVLVDHPKVMRVVALSGGYSREEANLLLARQPGLIASFSRALTEGLTAQQSDAEFNAALDASIASIYAASVEK